MQVGVGQQGEEARALDRHGKLPLVAGRGSGDARRDDLAGLVDEVLQDLDVLVVDPLDLLGGEAAELAAAEQRPLRLVLLVLAELPFAFTFASAGRGHLYSPSTNSMFVTCSTILFERLLFAARKPCSLSAVPRGRPATSRACASKATAPSSALTLRRPPASSCSDSCATLKSIAARPAGVWRRLPSSSSRALSSSRFSRGGLRPRFAGPPLHQRLGLLLLHHRRGRGHGLRHLDDEVAQHRVGELERVLELGERL